MKFIPNEKTQFGKLELGDAFFGQQRGIEHLYMKARLYGDDDGRDLAVDLLTGMAYRVEDESVAKSAKVHIVED